MVRVLRLLSLKGGNDVVNLSRHIILNTLRVIYTYYHITFLGSTLMCQIINII
jgi:hypothetical protein